MNIFSLNSLKNNRMIKRLANAATFLTLLSSGLTYAAPTVSMVQPINNAQYSLPATVTMTANASDSAGISKVDFYANGSLFLGTATAAPYTFTMGNVTQPGTYTLTAVATNTNNETTTSAGIDVTVNNISNQAPWVSLLVPANNTKYTTPAVITVTAGAGDTDGTVTKVDFYANGNILVGTATAAPYSVTVGNVTQPGTYTLTAVATDNNNITTTSTPLNVQVSATGPQAYFIHTDQLNAPQVISDGSNNIVWEWNSEPFGYNNANEDPSGNGTSFEFNHRFPGQYFDKETNTHYNYFRDYDPATGRYLQSDPIGLEGGINTYGYALGNPLLYIDPTGRAVPAAVAACMANPACAAAALATTAAVSNACKNTYDLVSEYLKNNPNVIFSDDGDGGGEDKRHSPDQEALGDLVQEITNGGRKPISGQDADTILDWGKEVGSNVRDDRNTDHWLDGVPHIHVPGSGVGHIPVEN